MTRSPSTSRITLAAVAEKAGVSKALVSALFSGKSYSSSVRAGGISIAQATAQRIYQAARQLEYQPADPVLKLRLYPQLGQYCFLINRDGMGGFSNYFAEILKGAIVELAGDNLDLSIAQFDPDLDYLQQPAELPHVIRDGATSRYMLVGRPNYSLVMALQRRGYHAVYLSRQIDGQMLSSVAADYEMAGFLAVQRLIALGHRRIALAAEYYFRNETFSVGRFLAGANRALGALGQAVVRDDIAFSRESDGNRPSTVLGELRARAPRPTAVFCFCDFTARRLINSALAAGMRIPEDLSVIGCNDSSDGREVRPNISSIQFPLQEMGAQGVRYLRQVGLQDDLEPRQVLLPVRLVERESIRSL